LTFLPGAADFLVLAKSRSELTAGELFLVVASVPVVQSLRERVEQGESLSFSSISPAAMRRGSCAAGG